MNIDKQLQQKKNLYDFIILASQKEQYTVNNSDNDLIYERVWNTSNETKLQRNSHLRNTKRQGVKYCSEA